MVSSHHRLLLNPLRPVSTDNVLKTAHDLSKTAFPPPPKLNAYRKYHVPHHTAAGLARPPSNPFEDAYASSVGDDSYQPSNTVSSGSSFTQPNLDSPEPGFPAGGPNENENDFFRDRGPPPEKKIRTPPASSQGSSRGIRAGDHPRKQSSESSTGGDSIREVAQPARPPNAVARLPAQRPSPLAETTTSPELAIKEASEAQRVTAKDQKRGKRNIVIQKYMVTAGLIGLK